MNRIVSLRGENKLTLAELAQIEANAERSKTLEAATILRLAAALREAMQVSEVHLPA